jgi:hypothetical protein
MQKFMVLYISWWVKRINLSLNILLFTQNIIIKIGDVIITSYKVKII